MNTTSFQGSAKIYQFPTRLRANVVNYNETTVAALDARSPRICDVAFGSWYHEAAVQQSDQVTKPR